MEEYLNPDTFNCTNCGQCCRLIVKVSEKDIQGIEETGLSRKEFLTYDPVTKNTKTKDVLQHHLGVCTFLRRKGEQYYCAIYEHRPDGCRAYPLVKDNLKLTDCRPRNWERWMPLEKLTPDEGVKIKTKF